MTWIGIGFTRCHSWIFYGCIHSHRIVTVTSALRFESVARVMVITRTDNDLSKVNEYLIENDDAFVHIVCEYEYVLLW